MLWVPGTVQSKLRPLVREMLEQLDLVNEIGRGVALNDFELVKRASTELEAQARVLQEFDIGLLHINRERDAEFDSYLMKLQHAAKRIRNAADREDGAAVFLGVEQLLRDGCTACHADFRDREGMLSPPVMFMTSLLHAWQDIIRGVATRDLELVGRQAREIQSLARVIGWDQVIEEVFDVTDAEERKLFGDMIRRTIVQARRIEESADQDRIAGIVEAARRMWTDGCIACHARFRD